MPKRARSRLATPEPLSRTGGMMIIYQITLYLAHGMNSFCFFLGGSTGTFYTQYSLYCTDVYDSSYCYIYVLSSRP